MPNTPKGITYPDDSSPVAVPADIENAAMDVDGLIVPNTGGTYTGSVSFTQSPSVPTPTSGLHAVNKTYADAINTDVTALETELGANPSGTFSTVADRLNTHDHPASSTDNTVARYDGTTGKIQGSTVVVDDNGRLTTSSGATGGYGFVSGAIHLTGTGAPESVVTAPIGSTYLQTDATNDVKGWIRWVKATGTGNTGWQAGPEADTGTRNLNGVAWANGWAPWGANGQRLRRVGNVVDMEIDLTKASATSDTCYTLPSGFRPFSPSIGAVFTCQSANSAVPAEVVVVNGDINVIRSSISGDVMYMRLCFITSDAWPSVLPGSAA